MREIVPDILTWPWFSERHGYDFNGYLVCLPDGNLCVDPVEPTPDALEALDRLGVAQVAITNRNHWRAANAIRERFRARTAIHAADAAYARGQGAEIDDELRVGERVGPLEVIGMAGKSPGEVALYWRQRRILIVGDAVIGNPPGALSFLPDKVMDDPAALRRNVAALARLDVHTLLVGDGTPILADAGDALRALDAPPDAGAARAD
jgi:glyoxylase-like metal-dependent hydrolase (beta-lactamase superfamily II)